MVKLFKLAAFLMLFCGVLDLGNGLKCYKCDWLESGDLTTPSSDAASIPDSTSCAWGRKPSDDFLVDCPAEGEEKPGVSYACVTMYIDGRYKELEQFIKGTKRQCASNYVEETTDPPEEIKSNSNVLFFKEEKQGRLADVHRDFQNPAGKYFLWIWNLIYDDASSVKVVACDSDNCKEEEEPVTEPSSTTQDSGATLNAAAILLIWLGLRIYKPKTYSLKTYNLKHPRRKTPFS